MVSFGVVLGSNSLLLLTHVSAETPWFSEREFFNAICQQAELIRALILVLFFSVAGQEPTFKMAVFDFFFTTGDTLRLVEGSGLYFLFTSGTTHESKLECEH